MLKIIKEDIIIYPQGDTLSKYLAGKIVSVMKIKERGGRAQSYLINAPSYIDSIFWDAKNYTYSHTILYPDGGCYWINKKRYQDLIIHHCVVGRVKLLPQRRKYLSVQTN